MTHLVPSVVSHTLVGRIGQDGSLVDLSGFLVGSHYEAEVVTAGTLFLGFNDGYVKRDRSGLDGGGVGDNSGAYTASIVVKRSGMADEADPNDSITPTHRFEHTVPAGLSIFSPALRSSALVSDGRTVNINEDGGILTAKHLIQLGFTAIITFEDGRFQATIGVDGVLLFGDDFPIEAGKGYVVNLLRPTVISEYGVAHGELLDGEPVDAPAAPRMATEPVWALVVAGTVTDALPCLALPVPAGTSVRVLYTRTGDMVTAAVNLDGTFLTAIVDRERLPVASEGDLVRVQLIDRNGWPIGDPNETRLQPQDLRHAFATVGVRALPHESRLLQNYPNPFNPETWIPFELTEQAAVVVHIYDVSGRVVRQLDVGYRNAGSHVGPDAAAHWDGRNDTGEQVSSGVYFMELHADDVRDMRRMLLRK